MPDYSVESLKHGIEKAEANIKIFEDAINKERETIGQFKWMIEQAERKAKEREAAKVLPEYAQTRCADKDTASEEEQDS